MIQKSKILQIQNTKDYLLPIYYMINLIKACSFNLFFIVLLVHQAHSIGLNLTSKSKPAQFGKIELNQLQGKWKINQIVASNEFSSKETGINQFQGISFVIYKNLIFFEGRQYKSNNTEDQCLRNNYRLPIQFLNSLYTRVRIQNPLETIRSEAKNYKNGLLGNLRKQKRACDSQFQTCNLHESHIISALQMAKSISLSKNLQSIWELCFKDQQQNQLLKLAKEQ